MCRHEDLRLDPAGHGKGERCVLSQDWGYGDKRTPEVCWSVSLDKSVNSMVSEKLCLTNNREGSEQQYQCLTSMCAYMYIHMCVHTHTHGHTHKCILVKKLVREKISTRGNYKM